MAWRWDGKTLGVIIVITHTFKRLVSFTLLDVSQNVLDNRGPGNDAINVVRHGADAIDVIGPVMTPSALLGR